MTPEEWHRAQEIKAGRIKENFSAKKGYIYEVTYASVDFSGMTAAKKYYVTVK